jgi:hypothetical protein
LGSIITDMRVYRIDWDLEYVYDGTRWFTTTESHQFMSTRSLMPLTASTTAVFVALLDQRYVTYIPYFQIDVFVNGTNDAANYWDVALEIYTSAGLRTTVHTFTTGGGSPLAGSTLIPLSTTNILLASGDYHLRVKATKVGAAGNLSLDASMARRLVG